MAEIRIRGLREVISALRRIDADIPGEMKEGMTNVAESVASRVRSKVPVLTGRARDSVKGRGGQSKASIVAGGRAAPHYPWLDFGGRVGRNKSISRPFIEKGRYIYPTIAEHDADIRRETDELLKGLIKKAGFDTRA